MNYNDTTSRYITNYYNVKKYHDGYYELIILKRSVRQKGFEDVSSKSKSKSNDYKLSNSITRSRSKVFEYSMCNDFEYFITLTIDQKKYDRYNLDLFIRDFTRFLRYRRKKYDVDLQYLLIPERHKDGAWHLHGLITSIPHEYLEINENGYLDWPDYRRRFGYVSMSKIKSKLGVSKYITKYISKSFDLGGGVTQKNKKMYYCSRGLKKSKKILEGSYKLDFNNLPFQPSFENEYVIKREFNNIHELKKVINIISQ